MLRCTDAASADMKNAHSILLKIQKLKKINLVYKPEAYSFVLNALDFTMKNLEAPRHISGAELLDGIRRYALYEFGPMARFVFEYWGVFQTSDFGEIVFDLIDAELLKRQDDDSIEEFRNVYDFKKVFDRNYEFSDSV